MVEINKTDKSFTLDTANRIYFADRKDFELLENFKNVLNQHYQGKFQMIEFWNEMKELEENEGIAKKAAAVYILKISLKSYQI